MPDDAYYQLRDLLERMPHGFPRTADGLEIRILKKIFTEEEAVVASKMKIKYETAEAVALRTGMDPAYIKTMLPKMADKGQILGVNLGGTKIYRLYPFVFGIYEFQLYRLDRELVDMVEEYFHREFGKEFYDNTPPLMRVVPIEEETPAGSVIEPYESIRTLIGNAKSWAVGDCICKKEQKILGKGCDNPMEVCLAIAPLEHVFDDYFWGRSITREEALAVMKKAEDAGLVHMTSNTREGHIFICNCCGCCCGILRGINELGHPEVVATSFYRAVVETGECTACGICLERCQVRAIDMDATASVNEKCIGCGLCVTTCPTQAIKLARRDEGEITPVPADEKEWMEKRALSRGRDDYRDLLK